jgi:hypothetical protein
MAQVKRLKNQCRKKCGNAWKKRTRSQRLEGTMFQRLKTAMRRRAYPTMWIMSSQKVDGVEEF